MKHLGAAWVRLRRLFARSDANGGLEGELEAHLQMHIDDNLVAGMSHAEARRRADLALGGIEQTKESYRDRLRFVSLDNLMRDFRFGVRLLRKNSGFTTVVVLILALGIGANTAIFTIVDRVLLRPLPYPDPARLATVARHYEIDGGTSDDFGQSGATWQALHDNARSIDLAANAGTAGINLSGGGQAQYVEAERVSAGFFSVLGVSPALGREFSSDEDRPNGPAAAILGYPLWVRAFGADPRIVGQSVFLAGRPHTIVGVMPSGFRSDVEADLWIPLQPSSSGEGGGQNYFFIARLRSGVAWAEADGEVAAIGAGMRRAQPLRPGLTMRLKLSPMQTGLTSDLRQPLLVLWGAVGAVLAICCFNIAGLLLGRGPSRASEIATRIALGGGRAAIVRQLLVESMVLATLGGASGIALGYGVLHGFGQPLERIFGAPATLDARVLLVTALASVLTSIVFGILPAFHASQVNLRQALVESGGLTIAGTARRWPRRLLVTAQVSLSLVLLIGAGLLIRTLTRLTNLPPGFDASHVMTATLSLNDARYRDRDSVNRLFDRTLERMRSLPGVEQAAICLTLPYERALNVVWGFSKTDLSPNVVNLTYVTPAYFDALRVPVLRGRTFNASDAATSGTVIVVNEAWLRHYSPDQPPIGRHIVVFNGGAPNASGFDANIVGVVGDVQQKVGWGGYGPVAVIPAMYVPASQVAAEMFSLVHTWFSPSWVVRTSGNVPGLANRMQEAVSAAAPQLPFNTFRTIDDVRSEAVMTQRVQAVIFAGFAALALLLTGVGIYGLVASLIAERTREFGVRIALGASSLQIIRNAALPGLLLGACGVAIGSLFAVGGANLMRSLIFGVSSRDPLTFAGAVVAVLLTIAVAAFAPALRLLRLNPLDALRRP